MEGLGDTLLGREMRVHAEVPRLAADHTVAPENPFELESAALKDGRGANIGQQNSGLHSSNVRLLVRPRNQQRSQVGGQALAPNVRRQVVRKLSSTVSRRHGVKADGANQFAGRALHDRKTER